MLCLMVNVTCELSLQLGRSDWELPEHTADAFSDEVNAAPDGAAKNSESSISL